MLLELGQHLFGELLHVLPLELLSRLLEQGDVFLVLLERYFGETFVELVSAQPFQARELVGP